LPGAEIVSADSRQVYRGMDIATAKPTGEEQLAAIHHGIDLVDPDERFTAADYREAALASLAGIAERGGIGLLVGGTGLYLRAAIAELSLVKAPPESADSELWSPETRLPTTIFGLDMDRARLYERIDARTEAIFEAGAKEEVERAEALGPSRTARVALGFEEVLNGDLERMQQRSRNYARRQLTWMRKIPDLTAIDRTSLSDAEAAAQILVALGRAGTSG